MLHAEPTLLVMMVSSKNAKFVVASVHMFHKGHTLKDRKGQYGRLKNVLRAHYDAETPVIVWGKECENGEMLQDMMSEFQLFAASQSKSLDRNTWFAKEGKGRRIDFILLPIEWQNTTTEADISKGVDVSIKVVDHRATGARARPVAVVGRERHKWRRMRYDRAAMADEAKAGPFIEELENTPQIPWFMEVNFHECWVSAYFELLLVKHFSKSAKLPWKSWISDRTMELVNKKRKLSLTWMGRTSKCATLPLRVG